MMEKYSDGTVEEIRKNPPHTIHYMIDGKMAWAHPMNLSRLYAVGQTLVEGGKNYIVEAVDVKNQIQVVDVRPASLKQALIAEDLDPYRCPSYLQSKEAREDDELVSQAYVDGCKHGRSAGDAEKAKLIEELVAFRDAWSSDIHSSISQLSSGQELSWCTKLGEILREGS